MMMFYQRMKKVVFPPLKNQWIYCLFPVIMFLPQCIHAQPGPSKDITNAMNVAYPALATTGGVNKTIPPGFEKQILFALSYFPELKNSKIKFRMKKSKSGIIATRPAWTSVFRRSSRRTYIVIINDMKGVDSARYIQWRNSPVNGQVGIVGHELCHILYFNARSGFGLIGLGIKHVSRRFMDEFENKTDSVNIERGLGYQLLDWNIYLRKAFGMKDPESGPDPFAGEQKRERYMSPASIRRMMAKTPIYREL
jgi:hypothetical protein